MTGDVVARLAEPISNMFINKPSQSGLESSYINETGKIKKRKEILQQFSPNKDKTAMNSAQGRGQLSNTHTYYLNQFYLRISYIDKSYKKHPNTELQQTAFI